MKKIKIRAWSKVYGQMLIVTNINFKDCMIAAHSLDNSRPLHLISSSDQFELMQSTGLYDKNRKEVYEGDIVKFNGKKRIVSYKSKYGCYCLNNIKNEEFYNKPLSELESCFDLEVIGNIFENKDLLEVEK